MGVIDARSFRRGCAAFATGITVATFTGDGGAPQGLTVNSFTSVSAVPPLVLICIDYSSALLPGFRAASHYGINVLSEEQQEISTRFAMRGQDRFAGVEWEAGESGVPLLAGALAHFECAVRNVVEAGDHAIFIAEATRLQVREGRPLLYFDSGYRRLG